MDKIKVTIANKQKEQKIPAGIRMLLRRACHATLLAENFDGSAEVNVTFTDDEQIRELNNRFRHINRSTDVLSFPLGSDGVYDVNPATQAKMLGDIVISMDHAVRQARDYGHSLQREMAFLTVHSMLHLLGYDHENGGLEAMRMREKEENILLSLGQPRQHI